MHLAWRNCNHRFLLTVLILFSLFFFLGLLFLRKKKRNEWKYISKKYMQGEDKLQLGDYASSDQLLHSSLSLTSAICFTYLECAPSVRTSSSLSTASCEKEEASLTKAWRLHIEKKNCKLVKKKFSLLASFEMYRVQHGGNAKWSYGVRVKKRSTRDLSIKTEVISSPSHLLA